MGNVVSIAERDAAICGTADPRRLQLMVRILLVRPEVNTAAQRARLAAAQRLLKGK